ncbi:unnamed protein product [Eruca vesicaria subsp. sativa]|uniref:Uncharacterized protein n=1 Tax=Eruca vesicaria subsp. sativa TaxID=29727 RepID=A0ABC8M6Y8_ERUVS|nr:unnamed protein product [Eruca vesicaria subsp. sativa]
MIISSTHRLLGGGCVYVQSVGDQKISSIKNQLASLSVKDAPIIAFYNPKRAPGLAHLRRLAYIKAQKTLVLIPEAWECLHPVTLGSGKEFKAVIEKRDTSEAKSKGQGIGTEFATLSSQSTMRSR